VAAACSDTAFVGCRIFLLSHMYFIRVIRRFFWLREYELWFDKVYTCLLTLFAVYMLVKYNCLYIYTHTHTHTKRNLIKQYYIYIYIYIYNIVWLSSFLFRNYNILHFLRCTLFLRQTRIFPTFKQKKQKIFLWYTFLFKTKCNFFRKHE